MRILIIRHGDPDYSIDSLTPTGWREAELLSERLIKTDITKFYVSPLGRAKDTASLTLKKFNKTAAECEWLREFRARIGCPNQPADTSRIVWDWLPADWTADSRYFDKDAWYTTDLMTAGNVREEYMWVTTEFDKLLARHGYVREHDYYRAVSPNSDTIALFCHFGLECVLLSHLMNVSPMILWHGMCAAPSSVTSTVTEERRQGIAYFRMSCFGDTSHLYVAGEQPSFSARFCETYTNWDERHD